VNSEQEYEDAFNIYCNAIIHRPNKQPFCTAILTTIMRHTKKPIVYNHSLETHYTTVRQNHKLQTYSTHIMHNRNIQPYSTTAIHNHTAQPQYTTIKHNHNAWTHCTNT